MLSKLVKVRNCIYCFTYYMSFFYLIVLFSPFYIDKIVFPSHNSEYEDHYIICKHRNHDAAWTGRLDFLSSTLHV